MGRLTRPNNPDASDATGRQTPDRDFTLTRGVHVYRLRADRDNEPALLREIRTIARLRPTHPDARRAA
jgi:hypothetical protein